MILKYDKHQFLDPLSIAEAWMELGRGIRGGIGLHQVLEAHSRLLDYETPQITTQRTLQFHLRIVFLAFCGTFDLNPHQAVAMIQIIVHFDIPNTVNKLVFQMHLALIKKVFFF